VEISKELEVGQKAIIEHLRAMEELGLLSSSFQKIERGRPRKYYDISQDIQIQIFIGPGAIKMNVVWSGIFRIFIQLLGGFIWENRGG